MKKKIIYLLGLGPGREDLITQRALSCLKEAEVIFAPKRIAETARNILKTEPSILWEELYKADEVFASLSQKPHCQRAAVLFSGDTGFYSGARAYFSKENIPEDWEVQVINGISSPLYFASKLQKSWQDWKELSLHGVKCNIIEEIRRNPRSFFILSSAKDINSMGEKIQRAIENSILSDLECFIGKNLSYEDEYAGQITLSQMTSYPADKDKGGLYVLLVENKSPLQGELPFLNDEDFIRHEKVPMTKKEIRQLSICSLALSKDSVLYDVGSGSGSVSVEGARQAYCGQVISIECKEEAFSLTQKNIEKFCQENVTCIKGMAPDCLDQKDLPVPTHVFIGGSRGNFGEIVRYFYSKNPKVRIVANFISLEGLGEMQKVLKEVQEEGHSLPNLEIKQVSVSRCEKVGEYNLLKAQNPVFIVSF